MDKNGYIDSAFSHARDCTTQLQACRGMPESPPTSRDGEIGAFFFFLFYRKHRPESASSSREAEARASRSRSARRANETAGDESGGGRTGSSPGSRRSRRRNTILETGYPLLLRRNPWR